ncbi:MAG TPA: Ig-like domain-containing protein [Solirubrobacteraceae bacterium]|nr:Ig-like domain-containing protein [Solirubrobacteraceae bacterium]
MSLTIVVTLATVAWLSPSQAFAAGSYQVSACNFAPEAANNSWAWATNDPAQPAHYAEHANCPYRLGGSGGNADQEDGLSTTDGLELSSGATPGTSAGWTFTAPAGTTITGLTYERYIGHSLDPRNSWSPALRADGTIVPGETCLDSVGNGETCSVGGPPGEGGEPAVVTGLSARELSLGVVCQAPAEDECVTGATQYAVWAAMYGATVTLSDPAPPTLSPPSGALWGAGEAGGFHKGTESVAVFAADVGGGVASIVLSADGRPVETYTAPCNFTFAQPCPSLTGTQTLTLPTTGLADGTHTLALVATDAAGNQSTAISEQITVDNGAPPPPVGLSATATQAGGSTFTATWTNPAGQVAPITGALYQVCPASGSGPCSAPVSAPAAGPATVTVPGPGSWSIAVWLTNAAGNMSPATAARTSVVVSPSGPGGSGPGTTGTKPTIRVTEVLRGRELVVHVSGPASGKVRVGFTGKLKKRTVASGAKTVTLKRGRLTAMFKLGPRTAAHALIRVSAKLDHELAVTSTLHRAAPHHRG